MRNKNKLCVAGNWKMNLNLPEAEDFSARFEQIYRAHPRVEVKIAPSFTNLYRLVQLFEDTDVDIIAQNMHWAEKGAYTGEVSAGMLRSIGVYGVILGHSERRAYFGETNETLRRKVQTGIENDMEMIYCVGETLAQREAGLHFETVARQITQVLFDLQPEDWRLVKIAYEPVWAIGTGKTASPEQADEMHGHIRELVAGKYGQALADALMILYGGSVKPANARDIFARPNVDGALVGGASLDADSFNQLVEIAKGFFE